MYYFIYTVLAVLLQQRGMLVLHANASLTPRGIVAISGLSGAGKSTTLTVLMQRGCPMLADDITALHMDSQGLLQTLTGDSAAALGTDISALPQYEWHRMQAAVPTTSLMAGEASPLRAVYWLETHPGQYVIITPLSGLEKFAAL